MQLSQTYKADRFATIIVACLFAFYLAMSFVL